MELFREVKLKHLRILRMIEDCGFNRALQERVPALKEDNALPHRNGNKSLFISSLVGSGTRRAISVLCPLSPSSDCRSVPYPGVQPLLMPPNAGS